MTMEHRAYSAISILQTAFGMSDGAQGRKMDDQRSRRFRSAREAQEKAADKEELLKMVKSQNGGVLPPETIAAMNKKAFDSNSITPGTPFMDILASSLRYWCAYKLNTDPGWANMKVIISDATVPGEGEHKIMEYIRNAKAQPDYAPNVRHCLYGLDADLIMLGLLSHDPHFCLLREEVTFGRQTKSKPKELEHQNFYLLHLSMVRVYLELEFQELEEPGALNIPFEMERVIDDFRL